MIEVVTDRRQISRYQRIFRENLRKTCRIKSVRDVWTPGGTERNATIILSKELGIWTCSLKDQNRFWNAFGRLLPTDPRKVSPNLEVNFPLQGINRRVSGVFLTDGDQVGVGYRGHIGGGRKGVGKSLFMRKYPDHLIEIQDGDKRTRVALVDSLDNGELTNRLIWLMNQVIKMKNSIKREGARGLPKEPFTPEFEGHRKTYSISSQIRSQVVHGKIVNALKSQANALGYHLNRDRSRDLFRIDRRNRMIASFEIKPTCSPYDIYTAIGQLKYHTIGLNAKQFAVLPDITPRESLMRLRRLGIESITFTLRNKAVKFHHLARKLRSLQD